MYICVYRFDIFWAREKGRSKQNTFLIVKLVKDLRITAENFHKGSVYPKNTDTEKNRKKFFDQPDRSSAQKETLILGKV